MVLRGVVHWECTVWVVLTLLELELSRGSVALGRYDSPSVLSFRLGNRSDGSFWVNGIGHPSI